MELPTRVEPPQSQDGEYAAMRELGAECPCGDSRRIDRYELDRARERALERKALAVAEANRVAAGEVRAVARLISRLEDRDPAAIDVMRVLLANTGRARTIGITGPPGSGKSTLVDQLIRQLRSRGFSVGVIAVDPSSPFTGGAILGDRLRMQEHATDPGVFMRSLASRGHLGGLSRATGAAVRVLDAAGFDFVIIETVGVGQSEVDIVRVADTVVLISVPGLGDDIQVIKAGIMEIGDIFVVNKADREGSDRVYREIRGMLETAASLAMGKAPVLPDTLAERHHHGREGLEGAAAPAGPGLALPSGGIDQVGSGPAGSGSATSGPVPALRRASLLRKAGGFTLDETGHPILPPVLKTIAETGEGCPELLEAILGHHEDLKRRGVLEARRFDAARAEIRDLIQLRVADLIEGDRGSAYEERLAWAVVARSYDTWEAADRLYESLFLARAPLEDPLAGGHP
ncbi:MAG TPA: methylmalonyl Co-A mutase-associated GTPase MeaB [Rectinemataceae bacterium]|nr:methylmalonyl Co-A mutase-associated GTPase MeaB [Rectinemataceae bacterium]